jgi:NitT/TauT family transport system permease protein
MDFFALILQLILDASASWIRMFIALGISIVISIAVGIYAAVSPRAERVILPVVDILQTVPILAFFPFALYIFVVFLPGFIGINAAVIFLIVTSMVWNIIFGVYESIKTLPKEFLELSDLYQFDRMERLKSIYIPAALPRIVEQSILSWSIGLFYLVTSEIFSIGISQDQVRWGIGVAFATLVYQGASQYVTAIVVFICFVVATRFLFFRPLEKYSVRYMRQQARVPQPAQGYERTVIGWVSRNISRAPSVLTSNRILKGRKHVSHLPTPKTRHDLRMLYYAGLAAIMLLLIYVFATNRMLLELESVVFPAIIASFVRIWFAFAVMLAIAIPLSVYLIFMSRQSSKYMIVFQIAASIPATILLPAIAVTLKSGELVAFAVFLLSGIWYVIFSVMASTRTLPQSVFEVKKIFGVKGRSAWSNIYIKAIVPGLITGAVTGIAAEWNASIVAEYFTNASGNLVSSVGTGLGKVLDLSLVTCKSGASCWTAQYGLPALSGSQGLMLMGVALLNLVVMIILINTLVWKRMYRKVSKIYMG